MAYRVTLYYRTPSGRASVYSETLHSVTYREAVELTERLLMLTPQRRVANVYHRTVEMV